MLSKLHSQVGTAGLIVAIVALIAALSGGAYAATGGLTGKQRKEVKKIAQTEAKKLAKTGPPGAAGPAGAAGAKGGNGTNGTNGAPGTPGTPGETGFTEFLPSGETETGLWGTAENKIAAGQEVAAISFPIPLESAPRPYWSKKGNSKCRANVLERLAVYRKRNRGSCACMPTSSAKRRSAKPSSPKGSSTAFPPNRRKP